jgi:hypothetical protein
MSEHAQHLKAGHRAAVVSRNPIRALEVRLPSQHAMPSGVGKCRISAIVALLWRIFVKKLPGTVTIEFALIAPVFYLVLFLIFATALTLFTQQNLDAAAKHAARLIRTGAITGDAYSSALRAEICDHIVLVPACGTKLLIYVAAAAPGSQAGSGFSSISSANMMAKSMKSSYATLGPNEDVILQLGYSPPWAVGLINSIVGGDADLLLATVVVETELY